MPNYVVEVKLSCHILVTDAQDKDEPINLELLTETEINIKAKT